jgi:hypothetical protein
VSKPARRVVPSVSPAALSEPQVARRFARLLDAGATLRPVGTARSNPASLLRRGYTPKHCIQLFDTTYFLTNVRQNPDIRFFVAYVQTGAGPSANPSRGVVHPRIFYKDVSLVWRSASHFVRSDEENWIGKGDTRPVVVNGEETWYSAEETTDLPLEIQTALETLGRSGGFVRTDHAAVELVLHRGPDDRLAPYSDFSGPRRRAAADPRNRINGGRSIARFRRRNDPTSLVFGAGFAPDFRGGIIEVGSSTSRLYGGTVRRFRILSENRIVQYLFMKGGKQVWIVPPQATSTEIMSYGVRTIDVRHDEDLCVPGYEYHFIDEAEDPPALFTQIPPGLLVPPARWIRRERPRPHGSIRCRWSANLGASCGAAEPASTSSRSFVGEILLKVLAQHRVVVRRNAVVRADRHRAVVREAVGLDRKSDALLVVGIHHVILEQPCHLVVADEQRTVRDLEAHGGLEEVE